MNQKPSERILDDLPDWPPAVMRIAAILDEQHTRITSLEEQNHE